MATKGLKEIVRGLASGYPTGELDKTQKDFLEVLEMALPSLIKKALVAQKSGKSSTLEVWEALRSMAEKDFQPALAKIERLKVVYVTSKFMNNKAVGTAITEVILARAKETEAEDD